MRDYRKYKVWELGHEITLNIYKSTSNFPKQEIYGIVSQMRRAAYSIPSNIVEGCGRESDAEFRRFLIISQGSANELEYFTVLAKDLGYLEQESFAELNDKVDKIRRSLNNLINKI
ncbi:four helix bundle protein [Zobellia nedashkovskayae]|uniref:four helix bundle protein n=1 Tax=Zobellia nedashkovskayae TaxID=2779510 RepID=UPI00188AC146|nr:four helix bundle protein [Zobellia nedashkovskayae]